MSKITVVYFSQTGNVRRFAEKLDPALFDVMDIDLYRKLNVRLSERGPFIRTAPYVLVCPTSGFGEVPPPVDEFLRDVGAFFLVGVAASGNRNWGTNYAGAGHTIAATYNVPLLRVFEFSGLPADVEKFSEEAKALWRRLEL